MNLPYRTRKRLRSLGTAALILALIGMVVWLCWVMWLERYMVFTPQGARLDFSQSVEELNGVLALPPEPEATIGVYYNEGDQAITVSTELTQLAGYYIDTEALLNTGVDAIRRQVLNLPAGTAVMLDVKSIYGSLLYTTKVSGAPTTDAIDRKQMDNLIKTLTNSELYTIARVPAFKDRYYFLDENLGNSRAAQSGLFSTSGYGLWSDDDYCFRFDPSDSGTMTYLIQICNELRDLGFDEVVFSEFSIPKDDGLVFPGPGTRTEVLDKAAADLYAACHSDTFAVSFQSEDLSITIPEGRSRFYLANVEAGSVASTAPTVKVTEAPIHLVFLAPTNDTRYDAYGALRPMESMTSSTEPAPGA